MLRAPRAPSRGGRAIKTAAILCVAAQALAIAHFSFGRHLICPTHGDLLDVVFTASAKASRSSPTARRRTGIHIPRAATALELIDHCELAQLMAGSHVATHAAVTPPPERTAKRAHLPERIARGIPPLELAPKQSPPV